MASVSLTHADIGTLVEGRHADPFAVLAHHWTVVDPYLFGPVLGRFDDHYAAEGTHLRLYDKLGAHLITHAGIEGVHFAVWARNALRAPSLATSTPGTAGAM